MEKIIAANWKMNNDFSDIKPFVKYVKKNAESKKGLVVCVPSIMVKSFADTAKKAIETGAQNCYYEEKGAFTGEISANMIKSANANYVIIGHSERRHIFGESNDLLNMKLKTCLSKGLKVIFCIGETLEEKPKYKSILKKQIVDGFEGITDFSNIIIAYEPVWAIGTGKVATTADISKIHAYIKSLVQEKFNVTLPVLYGGSVKPSNSKEILALNEVDGVLIGGASLKAEDYVEIANSR